MDAGHGVVRRIAWYTVFPSLLLIRSVGISFRLSILACALAGLLLSGWGGGLVANLVFAGTTDHFVQQWQGEARSMALRDLPSADADNALVGRYGKYVARSVVDGWWSFTAPLVRIFQPRLSGVGLSYLLLHNAWNLLVWAFWGGIITRVAAVGYTRQERLGIAAGGYQAGRQFLNHLLAPMLALLAALLFGLPLVGIGLLARSPLIAWVAGILWGGLVLAGLLVAVLAAGLVVGWPLYWAAIAVEQSDAFDAVSRSYAYVYQRPLHLAAYVLFVVVLAMLGTLAFYLLIDGALYFTEWAFDWGSGGRVLAAFRGSEVTDGLEDSGLWRRAAAGRRWWLGLAHQLKAAYPIGFLWTAAVGVYLLLRLHVDGAQTDEIVFDEPEFPSYLGGDVS